MAEAPRSRVIACPPHVSRDSSRVRLGLAHHAPHACPVLVGAWGLARSFIPGRGQSAREPTRGRRPARRGPRARSAGAGGPTRHFGPALQWRSRQSGPQRPRGSTAHLTCLGPRSRGRREQRHEQDEPSGRERDDSHEPVRVWVLRRPPRRPSRDRRPPGDDASEPDEERDRVDQHILADPGQKTRPSLTTYTTLRSIASAASRAARG